MAGAVTGLDPDVVEQMRDWISDCGWKDLDPEDAEELSAEQVADGVRRRYDGGVEQFLADSGLAALPG